MSECVAILPPPAAGGIVVGCSKQLKMYCTSMVSMAFKYAEVAFVVLGSLWHDGRSLALFLSLNYFPFFLRFSAVYWVPSLNTHFKGHMCDSGSHVPSDIKGSHPFNVPANFKVVTPVANLFSLCFSQAFSETSSYICQHAYQVGI